VRLPDGQAISFPIDGFAKYCLVNGVDQLGFLQSQHDAIADYEARHAARVVTR
jgi:3-isopropylmalate/(R)-2-methylmalate dehydratase small subunit